MRRLLLVLLGVLLALATWSSLYTVDRTEFVYVTQFGRHVATHDGAKDDEAGLHWKWPWPVQSVQRLDQRLQHFDLGETELLTRDPEGKSIDKTITVSAYVCWRIAGADGADVFVRRIGTAERAKDILSQRLRNQFGAAIGDLRMEDLVNEDAERVRAKMACLRYQVLYSPPPTSDGQADGKGLREQALEEYGIEVVDVRLRRMSHPPQVRESILARIKSERLAKAEEYRSSGAKAAEDIRSETAAKVTELKNEAEREKYRIERGAEIRAADLRKLAISKDPRLYAFQKRLAAFAEVLGDRSTTLWISVQQFSDLLRFHLMAQDIPAAANGPADGKAGSAPADGKQGGP